MFNYNLFKFKINKELNSHIYLIDSGIVASSRFSLGVPAFEIDPSAFSILISPEA